MKARAIQFVAPREIEVIEIDLPPVGSDGVLARTVYSGISSGTELLAFRGEVDPELVLDETIPALAGTFAFPFRYGYSCVGIVEESTGRIPEGATVFALHPHQERFVVDSSEALVIDGLEPRVAVLYPLVETALQIALDTDAGLGNVVVVTGMGVVGILTGLLVARSGATVIGAEPQAWRRDLAKTLGIESFAPSEIPSAVADLTSGRGCDKLVEASGNPDALGGALDWLRHEGVAIAASWYGRKPVTLPLGAAFHRRRLSIVGSQVSSIPARLSGAWSFERRRSETLRLMGEVHLEALATHEFPFEEAQTAFDALDRGRDGLLTAALRYLPAG